MSHAPSSTPTVVDLSPTEFTQLPDAPFLIDVRSALEFRTGHAPTARNLSLPRILLGLGGWALGSAEVVSEAFPRPTHCRYVSHSSSQPHCCQTIGQGRIYDG